MCVTFTHFRLLTPAGEVKNLCIREVSWFTIFDINEAKFISGLKANTDGVLVKLGMT